MLRVVKPTSPMSVGSWLLAGYSPFAAATAASALTGRYPGAGRAAGVGAAVIGSGVASYTAVLLADTAVPAWHDGYRELPLLFVGSASAAAAGAALIAGPTREVGLARRVAVGAAALELAAEQQLERSLGLAKETLHSGRAGRLMQVARGATALGAVGAATLAGRSRVAAAVSGTSLLVGSACTRFAIFAAGVASARDPKYTVVPQRERLNRQDQH
jgi:formate-dependent nitrite reductase membrane component NrfD